MPAENPISDDVRATLQRDKRIPHPKVVAVSERHGTVTLRGSVGSFQQRRAAVRIARSVRGVLTVQDELWVDPRDRWQDNEVRGVALQALISNPDVPFAQIDIAVADGWLTLKGEVAHQYESGAAFDAVCRLPGVGGITNEIKVITVVGLRRARRDHPKCVTTGHPSARHAGDMTDEHPTSTQPTTTQWDGNNVISVSFENDHEAYHALTLLKELDSQGRVGVQEAVVVVRGEDGQLVEKDGTQSTELVGTASGGLMGLLLGIIGGPFGVLIGGATGLMVGSLFDLAGYEETDSALSAISSSVQVGRTALLAVVVEQSPDVVEAAMSDVDGTVLRRSVVEVDAEIAAAEEAQRKAKREARKELVRSRHEHSKAAVNAKIDALKAKVHRPHDSAVSA